VVTARLLGGNSGRHIVRLENRTTVFANGNNIRPRIDMIRRTLLCSLDANMERPETRRFNRDPYADVIANRGRYIAAALTITRAHAAAGHPCTPSPYASYEEWSATVRASLMWLGCADPLQTQEDVQDEDPEKIILLAILEWLVNFGSRVTVAEMVQAAEEQGTVIKEGMPTMEYKYPELQQALIDAAGFRGQIDARRLGQIPRNQEGKGR
jgi:putative DNA primase/helicase